MKKLEMIKHATIKDLAQALGISKSTVSRALADHSDVKPETKRLVLEMAEKMNYRPNPYAQNLIRRRSKVIGVVVPEFVNSFFPRIIIQIQKVFEKEGFNVLIEECVFREHARRCDQRTRLLRPRDRHHGARSGHRPHQPPPAGRV
ncbi:MULTISPECIES: LacI family DNA-binding transcriptional regulator [Alistipes]|uniref:LacI family DNA-binding transcriptional regulator n=2 Tax=Alistipes TaxID=239759 RepID=UPI001EDE1E61|nr:LacI family DNA-binding transcriptional regulator [Alistipes sp.]MCG4956900.1 LacI family transcriptional regulator [Alistipes finegoldii]